MARTDPRPHYGTKRRVHISGYIDIWEPTHPLAGVTGYVLEHRKIMWDAGLLTDRDMQVHHINGDRADNRMENLVVVTAQDHARDHAEERGTAVNQYGEWSVKPRDQRVSAPRPERPCAHCGKTIPLTLRRDALYCSPACRITAWKRAN